LLDTNVLSEARRPEPDRAVLAWLDRLDEDRAFISVISFAEIRRGVALMEVAGVARRSPNGSPAICPTVSPAASCQWTKKRHSPGAI
jgi:hypothetical protein